MEYTMQWSEGLEGNLSAKRIREAVFVKEQGFHHEFDEIDDTALHVVVFADGVPAATGRLYQDDAGWHIGRVAVIQQFRGQNLGALVVEALENAAKRNRAGKITLSAQVRVQGFYEKQGYTGFGEIYLDEFCPHIAMEKQLSPG